MVAMYTCTCMIAESKSVCNYKEVIFNMRYFFIANKNVSSIDNSFSMSVYIYIYISIHVNLVPGPMCTAHM